MEIEQTIGLHRQHRELKAEALQIAAGVEHRPVLGGHRDNVPPPREPRLTQALDGQVVGFGGPAGEHHRVGRNRQATGQTLTGEGQLGCGL